MKKIEIDRHQILKELIRNYRQHHKKSEQLYKKACQYQIRGGSHNLRLLPPFPFYVQECSGSKIKDIDGNTYIDFWQGHFANILGHNPKFVIKTLLEYFQKGQGLVTGFPDCHQAELAELILTQLKTDKIRFTTSGTLASMYAVMLAKAFTQRKLVMKMGGGWHGAQPYLLKGISIYDQSFSRLESAGLPDEIDSMIVVTRFNDKEDLEEKFKKWGEQIACLVIEPFLGAGGFIFASLDYIQRAKELTSQYGSILIFDEVVSGFRFCPGGVQTLYGVKPDLTILGKAVGGGMPVSAVAGREDIMALCDPETKRKVKVKFEGGTFSAHPASMLAGATFLKYLIIHAPEIYPRLGKLGDKLRKEIENIFSHYGFNVKCTGYGQPITNYSSCVGVQFLRQEIEQVTFAEQVWDPDICDIEMMNKDLIYSTAMGLSQLPILKKKFSLQLMQWKKLPKNGASITFINFKKE